jgi:hypothetical protein
MVAMDTPGLREQIEAKLVTPRPDCLLWPGAVDRGYGRIFVDGTAKRVHRVMWELANGPIPDDLTIDHLCRVRSCVNVEHMEVVERGENIRRAVPFRPARTGAGGGSSKGTHCRRGHEFTPENTYVKPSTGRRTCVTCRRDAARARYQANS